MDTMFWIAMCCLDKIICQMDKL